MRRSQVARIYVQADGAMTSRTTSGQYESQGGYPTILLLGIFIYFYF